MSVKVLVPKKLCIGSHEIKFFWSKELIDARSYGRTAHIQGQIYLNPVNSYSQKVVTWWHEVLHRIGETYCADSIEERVVDSLAEGLGQVTKELGIEFDFSDLREIARE